MPPRKQHDVSVIVDRRHVEGWTEYEVNTDMQEAADTFSMRLPLSRTRWDRFELDAPVQVFIDDTQILDGFIDQRNKIGSKGGSLLEITGRDKGGRLVDESMPLLRFTQLGILELAAKVVGIGTSFPIFNKVSLSNLRNRKLVRGRGSKTTASSEPALDADRNAFKKVNPGETRWQVLKHFLEENGFLAWSTADGKELIVGKPNQDKQGTQYSFFYAEEGSERANEVNCLSMNITESIAERYSQITVCGSGRGSGRNYGKNVLKRRAIVKNGTGPFGIGADFSFPKRLLLADDNVRNVKQALLRAQQYEAERDADAQVINVVAAYHGQVQAGREPTLFGFDTLAFIEDEETGTRGDYFMAACQYRLGSKEQGEQTNMRFVPKGTELRV